MTTDQAPDVSSAIDGRLDEILARVAAFREDMAEMGMALATQLDQVNNKMNQVEFRIGQMKTVIDLMKLELERQIRAYG
jgi:hypothetical protein